MNETGLFIRHQSITVVASKTFASWFALNLKTNPIDHSRRQQVLDRSRRQQVLDRSRRQQVIDRSRRQQVLDSYTCASYT